MRSIGLFVLGSVTLILAGINAIFGPKSDLALILAIWGASLIITSNER